MIGIVVSYLLFWILLSEKIRIESVCIGIFICLLVVFFNKGILGEIRNKNNFSLKNLKLWLKYILTLLKEILISNIHVAAIVLNPKIKVSPTVVTFNTKLKNDLNKTILANSITLTPGTLTVSMENNELTVHCLEKEYEEGLINSKFEEILKKVEE